MYVPKAQNPRGAVAFILIATAFIAATMVLAKLLTSDAFGPALPVVQVSFGRYLFALIAISAVLVGLRPQFTRVHWRIHILRTACGWTGVTLMFASVAFIPLADATAISFLNPVFGMLFAIPILRETVGPWRWSAALIALLGALVLLRPTAQSFEPGALLALGAAVALGFELVVIKTLAGRESPLQILFLNNFTGCVVATCAVLFVWQSPTPAQWGLLVGLGLLMAAAQACYVNAMARADASFVAPLSYATLIFAALYDGLLFDSWPDRISTLGVGIILTGAVILAWRESRAVQEKRT